MPRPRLRFIACAGLAAFFSMVAPAVRAQAPVTRDQQDFANGTELAEQGKFEEARKLFAGIPENYPTSAVIPQAILKLGYVYFRLNDFDRAVENLNKVPTLKGVTPDVAELALSLAPQVLSAKAAGLAVGAPARKAAFEAAVKQFDTFLQKFPASDEVETAYYGKAVALYQLARYEDASTALRTNLQKFPQSESVLDSEYLLALTIGTVANVAGQKGGGTDPAVETNYDNAEKLLGDIINKRTDVALSNDARFQIGELEFSRAGFTRDEPRRKALYGRALEAFRQVAPQEVVILAQKARIEGIKVRRQAAVSQQHDLVAFRRLGRVVEKEQEKQAAIEARLDQTLAAKIKMAEIFVGQGKLDEARVLLNFVKPFASADAEQVKQIDYYTALSLASQNMERRAAVKALAEKAEASYNEFRTAHKGDPIAENLAVVLGAGFVESEPEKAIKYFQESSADYPQGKSRINALAEEASAYTKLGRFDEALKAFKETLAQNPEPPIAAMADFGIATVLKETGKAAEAMAAYKNVRDKYPGQPQAEQAAFWFAQLTLEKSDWKNALAEFQAFIKKYTKSVLLPNALFYLGQAEVGLGHRAEALADYKELAEKYPQSEVAPFSYFSRAQIHRDAQKNDLVVATMREFIKAYPDGAQLYQAYDYIGQILISEAKEAEAIQNYEEMVKSKPQHPNAPQALLRVATLWKGLVDKIGRYVTLNEEQKKTWTDEVDRSVKAAERVVQEYPESLQVALALQDILDCEELRRGAKLTTDADIEKYFTELAEKFKDKPATRSKIVFTLASHLYDHDKAKAFNLMSGVYDAKQRYAPGDLDLYGTALIEQKKLDEAMAVYTKLAADYPVPNGMEPAKASREVQEAQAMNLFGTGKVMQEQNKGDEAKARFDTLEKLYSWSPKMLEANYGIALSQFQQKSYEEAMKRLVSVIGSRTASSDLRAKGMLLLGRIHEEMGNFDAAIDNYIKINTFYSGVPSVASEGLWRGANLLEKEGAGQIAMPKPATPAPKASPKPGASPGAKTGTPKPAHP